MAIKLVYIPAKKMYIEERGGLANPNTNQRFIDLHTNKILNNYFVKQEAI